MGKGLKSSAVPSRQALKCQARSRVEHLQSMVSELTRAREECRSEDVAKLVEQVSQVLSEWKTELDEPSPACSLLGESLGSFEQFSELKKFLDLEDDATSPLEGPPTMRHDNGNEHGHVHVINEIGVTDFALDKEAYYLNGTSQQQELQTPHNHVSSDVPHQHHFQGFMNHMPLQHEFQSFESHSLQHPNFQRFDNGNNNPNAQDTTVNSFGDSDLNNLLTNDFDNEIFLSPSDIGQWGLDDLDVLPNVNLEPSAFLRPTCALWDCARPAQGSELCSNYCSSFHAELARKECPPGSGPVLRPGGIELKDGLLILALKSKIEGKEVGIPECPGATSTKSPWNAPELFDISILEGEKIREWLFFDKSRRAFETGTRKQRSLPDHEGRGWHESRKIPLSDYGGRKRSYYADPQPQKNFDWHLFEYEVDNCDVYALYRLELKATAEKSPKLKGSDEKKKSVKSKVSNNDPLLDLQKQMGRLTAVVSTDDKPSGFGKTQVGVGNIPGSSTPSSTPWYAYRIY